MKKVLSIVLVSCSFIGFSQPPGGGRPPEPSDLMEKMDENNDRKLSKEEVKGPLRKDFSTVDLDGDGFLTIEELKKAPKPKRR